MTNWNPDPVSPKGPLYVAIADALSRDVTEGNLQPGDRLPTHRELARRLGVNVVTVTRAYAEAARRGLVEGEVGRGTFVRDRGTADFAHFPLRNGMTAAIDFNFNVQAGKPGLLDPATILNEIAADIDPRVLGNGYAPGGFPEHRAAGAEWMKRSSGMEADPERTLITVGAQHAMNVAFATLTEPGDVLLTEGLAYPGVKALGNLLHLRVQPLELDGDGILPSALEDACRRGNPKVLHVNPTLQNPTGSVMPLDRREEIAAIATRHGVTIVEDDTTGYLLDNAPPPIASLVPESTWFLTSLSKSLYGGLRIGYLHTPKSAPAQGLIDRTLATIAATAWMAPPLMCEIATRWIESGRADELVLFKREEALARRKLFDRIVDIACDSDPAACFVWMPLPAPWRCNEFVSEAHRRGVAVTPAEAFAVGRAGAPHAIRISLGTPPTREDVEKGLRILAPLLARRPELSYRALV